MHAAHLRAPLKCDTVEQIAQYGECFQLTTEQGGAVFVLRADKGVLWIDAGAATGKGQGITEAGLELAQVIAKQMKCNTVALETNRRGMVKKSKQCGFEIAGYILKKDVNEIPSV